MKCSFGFGKYVPYQFEETLQKVVEELKNEGFGVLTEIDVKTTLKNKLNLDVLPYRILGACNPTLAHSALELEPSIGLLLPCNVVVRQADDGRVYVEFMDPYAVLELVNNKDINKIAQEVKQKLERVMNAI